MSPTLPIADRDRADGFLVMTDSEGSNLPNHNPVIRPLAVAASGVDTVPTLVARNMFPVSCVSSPLATARPWTPKEIAVSRETSSRCSRPVGS